jgi:hypothetical protein
MADRHGGSRVGTGCGLLKVVVERGRSLAVRDFTSSNLCLLDCDRKTFFLESAVIVYLMILIVQSVFV